MKKFLSLALALITALSLTACGDNPSDNTPTDDEAVQTVTLKMGHKMSEDSLDGKAFQKFADLVYEKSDGSVKIDLYPSSQLGDGSAQVNNVLLGSQDIYAESYSEWVGVTPLVLFLSSLLLRKIISILSAVILARSNLPRSRLAV